ncbi:MAG: hypothetical protein IKO80_07775 [Lachnospiraceae bacterium]|nr:hypothetical protein [Lachnospiraceae bacterium]
MRITNKIMQNNQMYNINQNKIKEDKYATQMATNKKINRGSEDPVVAIRALRLRSNVSELTQYYEKNSKDAESWLKVTEDALSTVTELLTSSIAQANKGANKDLTTTDLAAIISEMTELSNEYYSTGNVDYGGRYVFTGYRTDTPLTFTDKTSKVYTGIHDGFNAADIDSSVHISGSALIDPNSANALTEVGIDKQAVGRIRLSYSKLDEQGEDSDGNALTADQLVSLKYRESFEVPASSSIEKIYTDTGKPQEVWVKFSEGGTETTIKVTLPAKVTEEGKEAAPQADANGFLLSWNSDGTFRLSKDLGGSPAKEQVINLGTNGSVHSSYTETTLKMESDCILSTTSSAEEDTLYQQIAAETGVKAWLNAETGEILLSDKLREQLTSLKELNNTDAIEVVYNKSQWTKGDIRPENLFECTTPNPNSTPTNPLADIHYNGGTYGHTMGYDVGYNQVIDVNTLASDVFTTDVRRSMDDLTAALEKLQTLETTISQIKDHMEGRDETSVPPLSQFRAELAAAEKAQTFLREDLQEQLEHKITEMQRALDVANLAVTQNGTRSRRLELIQNRLMNQTTTFKTLQSDNEDIDMAETATNLSTSQTVYNAALMATGKISQTSLMDYI